MYRYPGSCPVCGREMQVSVLTCTHCQSKLEGEFAPCKFCRLNKDQIDFIEVFIKCRGSIKDVEKELGISYPTVKNRLEGAIQALGYRAEKADLPEDRENRQKVLNSLEKGEITSQEAVRLIKKMSKKE